MKNDVLRARRGFTLIEILVVVGIIALLAAVMFPVMSRAREGGRTKACLSNMKQLGLAFQQYTQDNSRRYPYPANYQHWANGGHWVTGGEPAAGGELIPKNFANTEGGLTKSGNPNNEYNSPAVAIPEKGALYPYVKSAQVYVCPSTADAEKKRLGYAMNCSIGGMSDVRVREPASIIVLIDEGKTLNDGFFNAVRDSLDGLTQAHNIGGNLLFADGHAKFYAWKTFPLGGPTPEGEVNSQNNEMRTRVTGSPRLHDKAFGSNIGLTTLDAPDGTFRGGGRGIPGGPTDTWYPNRGSCTPWGN
jgi:prepilin-type N-terminal cleavage/methylation domain-containing protein/prepilin-type processing-associated H-X9-DG protein